MYDPTIGRWISEDPMGFEAGDPNLYRYVGNMPNSHVDPSGLDGGIALLPLLDRMRAQWEQELQRLPIGEQYWARVSFCGGTIEQRRIVRERTLEAARRLTRALDVLENNWPAIQRRYQGVIPVDFLLRENRRQFYIDNIRYTLNRLQDRAGEVNFQIEERNDAALTRGAVYRFGWTIYLYPVSFDDGREEQIDTIIHELGRRFPRITGDSGMGTNNIYNWDSYIRILSQDYDIIRNAGQ